MDEVKARQELENHLRWNHKNLSIDALEITGSKGYWRVKGGCPGGDECRHAYRGEIGPCGGGGELTIMFSEHGKRDGRGRYVRPFRVWEALHYKFREVTGKDKE